MNSCRAAVASLWAFFSFGAIAVSAAPVQLNPNDPHYLEQLANLKSQADGCIYDAARTGYRAGMRDYTQIAGFAYKMCAIAMDPVIASSNPKPEELASMRANWIQPILDLALTRMGVKLNAQ